MVTLTLHAPLSTLLDGPLRPVVVVDGLIVMLAAAAIVTLAVVQIVRWAWRGTPIWPLAPTTAIETPRAWYAAHDCDHAHCPDDCSHPQPVLLPDGRLVCGRCAIVSAVIVEMIPCRAGACA